MPDLNPRDRYNRARNRCLVSGCTASNNGESGVVSLFVSAVQDCLLSRNDMYGVHVTTGGGITVRGCTISESPTGIRVDTHSGNRIEGNSVSFCPTGISVVSIRNIVLRNSVGIATTAPYSVVAGNLFGPIVTEVSVGGSSNPHANYAY